MNQEKNNFTLAALWISPKNRIQAAVKIKNDCKTRWKLYVVFNGPFEIYEDYPIVHKPILSESATKAIEFYVQKFSKSIPYVWAHEDPFFTTYSQTKTTRRIARKISTNVVGQKSNYRLVTRVLENKNAKWFLRTIPQAYVYIHTPSVRVKLEIL